VPEVEAGRVWKTGSGGVFVLDHVIGKHLYIDYAVAIEGGRVRRVDILAYRESYGGEVRSPSWLSQFVGKTSASPLKVGSDIRNISGATLSSMHVTEGVKRILAAYGHLR
jgi:FMN-binding domain